MWGVEGGREEAYDLDEKMLGALAVDDLEHDLYLQLRLLQKLGDDASDCLGGDIALALGLGALAAALKEGVFMREGAACSRYVGDGGEGSHCGGLCLAVDFIQRVADGAFGYWF